MQQTKTVKIEKHKWNDLRSRLESLGFKQIVDPNPYIMWKYKGEDMFVTLYSSGKCVLQGENVDMDLGDKSTASNHVEVLSPHVGADEVGKGDYFGPLVVAACYLDSGAWELIKNLGVDDSKKLTDERIVDIYNQIQEKILYRVLVTPCSQYNDLVGQKGNVSIVLAHLHAQNIKNLVSDLNAKNLDYGEIVIDQFSSNKSRLSSVFKGYNMTQFHHAESKDSAVALASIIARATFVKEMELLNDKYEMEFPYGASDVINFARSFVSKYGASELRSVAKVGFKTTQKVLGLLE